MTQPPLQTPLGPDHLHDSILPYVRTDVIRLRLDHRVTEALNLVRAQAGGQQILYLYVVDEDDKLVGVVPTRRLLVSGPDERVRDIMVEDVVAIPSWATVLVASEFFINRRFLAVPVIEDDGRLVGVVDISLFTDEMVTLARQSFDDIFQIIGVHVTQSRSPWTAFRDRFPWLLTNVVAGVLCALILSRYEGLLQTMVVLALFIPVVLALSESVSMQSVTLTLQSLHAGRFDWRLFRRASKRELFTAVLLGFACGAIVGLICWVWKGSSVVGGTIACAIWVAMTASAMIGLVVPTALKTLVWDPRLAAGPIALATADVTTLVLFFNLARTLA
jgi:magnesium transporter